MPKIQLKESNLTIHYLEKGQGKTLLVLHGLGNNASSWDEQLIGLSDYFHVIAWDAPGYGESSDPQPFFNYFSDFSFVLKEFTEALNIQPMYLLGHSMGAALAIDFAYRFPSHVEKLILADATRGAAFLTEETNHNNLHRRLHAINVLGSKELAQSRARNLLSSNAPEETINKVQNIMEKVRPAGYISVSQSLFNLNQKDIYGEIDVPTLIICGEEDCVTPIPESEYIHKCIKNSEFVTIPKTGHLCYLEDPVSFNAHVIEFLSN
ncbi:alpha/beta hydrolase [Sporosarcina sp. P21c]|uniref:alpha/beta fold hydrolase n=1 Tax=unclassified Sporosarcina TaxID=2647733 RepID=UPI000C166597|nr:MULTISPECIES: alpha/beta hydrolase [unclassified Sporosarcina]PIC65812.1 alpha/beta hydrolase [Sporosarcina sp. P16a]PIC87524.1 alpha/beta hydrolase [Sporosarcina sp. P21c]PIC91417.1 alpha/beta hydrolase [Sporosarcina sp. P25]